MPTVDIQAPILPVKTLTKGRLKQILNPFCIIGTGAFSCEISYGIPDMQAILELRHDNARSLAHFLKWPHSPDYNCAIRPGCRVSADEQGGTLVSFEDRSRRWKDKAEITEHLPGPPTYWQALLEGTKPDANAGTPQSPVNSLATDSSGTKKETPSLPLLSGGLQRLKNFLLG
jgi:hypothetical protein